MRRKRYERKKRSTKWECKNISGRRKMKLSRGKKSTNARRTRRRKRRKKQKLRPNSSQRNSTLTISKRKRKSLRRSMKLNKPTNRLGSQNKCKRYSARRDNPSNCFSTSF